MISGHDVGNAAIMWSILSGDRGRDARAVANGVWRAPLTDGSTAISSAEAREYAANMTNHELGASAACSSLEVDSFSDAWSELNVSTRIRSSNVPQPSLSPVSGIQTHGCLSFHLRPKRDQGHKSI